MRAGAEWHRPFFKQAGTVLFCLTATRSLKRQTKKNRPRVFDEGAYPSASEDLGDGDLS